MRYNWAADYRGKAHGGLRAHASPRAAVAQQHGEYRYRLRLRRQAHRASLSGAGDCFGTCAAIYYEPRKPFLAGRDWRRARSPAAAADDVLDIEDVVGKRIVDTRLDSRITIREENAIAALEVMSRFAVDPKWLIYLPPTMSPSETIKLPDLLEHPQEAFAYYRHEGIPHVVCEQKHMGSRAVVIVCRDEDVSRQTLRRDRAGDRRRLHAHGAAASLQIRNWSASSWSGCRRPSRSGTLGRTEDRLALPRLRVDAVVSEGPGTVASTVRAGWQPQASMH